MPKEQLDPEIRYRMCDYAVNFKAPGRCLVDYGEDYDLIHEFTGKIVLRTDEGNKEVPVGQIEGAVVDIWGAKDRRLHPFDLLDTSRELHAFYGPLFDQKTAYYHDELNLEIAGNLLLIHDVRVARKHRGQRVGLLALLRTLIEFGGGCALAALKPFPLQYNCRVNDKNEPAFRAAQRKLADYWALLGFKPVRNTEYLYFDLSLRMPTPEQLLKGLQPK